MKVVIPVAGQGTRLRPHTLLRPKMLLPLAGKPILGHIVDTLVAQGIREFVFVVGYLREQIESYIREHFDIQATYIHQEPPRGLGHAIYLAGEALDAEEPILIVLGDTIFDANLKLVMESPHTTLGVHEVEDPRRFGVAVLDEHGFVKKVVEKPQKIISHLALVGIYWIRRSGTLLSCLKEIIKKDIQKNGEYWLTDGIQMMIDRGEKITVFNVEGWYDCGRKETLLDTHRKILEKMELPQVTFKDSTIIPPVYIHPNAKISRSVIGPFVSIAEDCAITNSVIRDTIIDAHSEVKSLVLSHSIIGHHVRLNGAAQNINVADYSVIDNIK